MNKKIIAVAGCVFVLGHLGVVFSGNTDNHDVTLQVNSIAEVAVTTDVSLTVMAPVTPGDVPQDDTDNTAYLQYTSTVPSGQTRVITAAWGGSDSSPAGTQMKLQASPQSGKGTGAGEIIVSSSSQSIITSIGSCYTGTGGSDGAQLTYTLEIMDATALEANASETVTVTFTVADAS